MWRRDPLDEEKSSTPETSNHWMKLKRSLYLIFLKTPTQTQGMSMKEELALLQGQDLAHHRSLAHKLTLL